MPVVLWVEMAGLVFETNSFEYFSFKSFPMAQQHSGRNGGLIWRADQNIFKKRSACILSFSVPAFLHSWRFKDSMLKGFK